MIVFLLNSITIIVIQSAGTLLKGPIWSGFIKAPYTILNTVTYGWRAAGGKKRGKSGQGEGKT